MMVHLNRRISKLEARCKRCIPSLDLWERIARYEEIYEKMERGEVLDISDPYVKRCLEYERFYEAML